MKRIEQRVVGPSTDDPGDCWKCCIASILDLDYEEVPHFVKQEVDGEVRSYWNATLEWLKPRGLTIATFALWGQERPYLKWGSKDIEYLFSAPGHWIAGVWSPRITEEDGSPALHAVVMHGSEIVWDPARTKKGEHYGFNDANLLVKL